MTTYITTYYTVVPWPVTKFRRTDELSARKMKTKKNSPIISGNDNRVEIVDITTAARAEPRRCCGFRETIRPWFAATLETLTVTYSICRGETTKIYIKTNVILSFIRAKLCASVSQRACLQAAVRGFSRCHVCAAHSATRIYRYDVFLRVCSRSRSSFVRTHIMRMIYSASS